MLFDADAVVGEEYTEEGEALLAVSLPLMELNRLLSREKIEFDQFVQHFVYKAD